MAQTTWPTRPWPTTMAWPLPPSGATVQAPDRAACPGAPSRDAAARRCDSAGSATIVSDVSASVKLETWRRSARAPPPCRCATKANSPPGPSSSPVSIAAGHDRRNSRARPMIRMAAFTAISPATPREQPHRIAGQLAKVDVHADGEEEQAEQQALERIDGGLDRLAEFGLGQQQPGDEGAERHRQAGHGGGHAGADDHEQRRGDEQVARCRPTPPAGTAAAAASGRRRR